MDRWARKTARLAKESDYLDQLQEIYPVSPKARVVSAAIIRKVKKAFEEKDKGALLKALLKLERFPYKESYTAFFRADPTAMQRNPRTVDRICNLLFGMGWKKVEEGIRAPKDANTQRGNEFKRWTRAHFRFVKRAAFEASRRGVVFLDASDTDLRNFANSVLDAALKKRPDFVAKVGVTYVIGEAKFVASGGGNQNAGFLDATSVAGHPSGRAIKAAVLDGVVWIRGSSFYKTIEASNLHIFSALLLKNFLASL